eukprot:NODE_341_length_10628_cov_0.466996.p4 type:complete len:218 gc:universal NODE_341_length_10628_cov_0.466996:327-980(+)
MNYSEDHVKIAVNSFPLFHVKRDVTLIRYIKDPNEEVQIAAFESLLEQRANKIGSLSKQRVNMVESLFEERNYEVEIETLGQMEDLYSEAIENPCEAVKLLCVQHRGIFIEHIEDPSEDVQREAAQEDGLSLEYMVKPSQDVQDIGILDILECNYKSLPGLLKKKNYSLSSNALIKLVTSGQDDDLDKLKYYAGVKQDMEALFNKLQVVDYIVMTDE